MELEYNLQMKDYISVCNKLKDIEEQFLASKIRHNQSRENYEAACEFRKVLRQKAKSLEEEYYGLLESFSNAWGNSYALEKMAFESSVKLKAACEQYVASKNMYTESGEMYNEWKKGMHALLSKGSNSLCKSDYSFYTTLRKTHLNSRAIFCTAEEQYDVEMRRHSTLVEQHREAYHLVDTLLKLSETMAQKYIEALQQYRYSKQQCKYLKKIRKSSRYEMKKQWKFFFMLAVAVQKMKTPQVNYQQ